MLYSSLLFIYGFLPVSLLINYVSPKKVRDAVLLVLSLVFCGMFGLYYLGFVSVFTLVNYCAAVMTDRLRKKGEVCVLPFSIGIVYDMLTLFLFRTENISGLRRLLGVPEGFFPLGVSFMVLGAIGMLVDVYNGKEHADRSIVRFSLYFLFFPRIIMGPLLRYSVFSKILREKRNDLEDIGVGFTIFVKGLVKKAVLADQLYMLYTAVRSVDVQEMSLLTAWLGITAYLLCAYFTLSGFADMGTGIGYCFGFRLPQSFNYPLLSSRVRYFSARWHVQVVQWFRRYITKPLTSVFRGRLLRKASLVFAWGILGFWYGFSLNGMIWGFIIGTGIVIEGRLRHWKIMDATGMIYTYIITLIASVFLSGSSILYSFRYLFAMIGGNRILLDELSLYLLKSYIVLILIGIYASTNLFRNMMLRSGKNRVRTAVTAASPLIVLALLILSTIMMSYTGSSGMILFRL